MSKVFCGTKGFNTHKEILVSNEYREGSICLHIFVEPEMVALPITIGLIPFEVFCTMGTHGKYQYYSLHTVSRRCIYSRY